jgi:hypothetical protein
MPIEGIIDALRMAVLRYPEDAELKCAVKDAEMALTEVDAEIDKAYLDGKYVQQSEDFELVLTKMFG